ncbi:2,4'-dihydroxyacetophenone dioxygenase [Comamonas serinivorans]|uniref:2,4'-dihydroxyacetophenone dioxygenase n=1 Tax=Comamonas serinivorans TaxID=1082851 RepID=A0A1Y0EKI0_9BURK|nr:2,4'-dihydroxyacetophenone dioxygenase family protein [Comamonas serinivorans]ARU03938.1 2,4'-dihydroxyacetophenone dioxygenase [Comamonas serinivorans]
MTQLTITEQDELLSVNIHDMPTVPGGAPGAQIIPLFLDRENGTWVLYGRFAPGTRLPKHFHTGTVHFFTTKGRWNYVEYPQNPQTAGSYLYEPAGSIHTFAVPDDATEAAEGFMVVHGANINFEGDQFLNIRDAGAIEDGVLAYLRSNQLPIPPYISPRRADFKSRQD